MNTNRRINPDFDKTSSQIKLRYIPLILLFVFLVGGVESIVEVIL